MSNIETVSMTSQPKPPTLSLDHLARAATITHRWDQMSLGTLVLSYALYVSSTHPNEAMITTLPISHGRKLTSFHDDALPQPSLPHLDSVFFLPSTYSSSFMLPPMESHQPHQPACGVSLQVQASLDIGSLAQRLLTTTLYGHTAR